MRNTNSLIGRYPGIDGMKTGFICASGFNVVATATRDGKRLIAVVLGAPSSPARAVKAAELLEARLYAGSAVWLTPSLGNGRVTRADRSRLRPICTKKCAGPHRKTPAAEEEEAAAGSEDLGAEPGTPFSVLLSSLRAPMPKGAALLSDSGRRERRSWSIPDRRAHRRNRHVECDRGSGSASQEEGRQD